MQKTSKNPAFPLGSELLKKSGRGCFINGILHPLQIPDAHEISGNSSQKPPISATKTPFSIKLTGNNLIKTRYNTTISRKHNEKILQNQCIFLDYYHDAGLSTTQSPPATKITTVFPRQRYSPFNFLNYPFG